MRQLRIVQLSSVHEANDTRILHKVSRSLVDVGVEVILIAHADCDANVEGVTIWALNRRSGNRFLRMTLTTLEVLRLARKADGDAYQFHDPELIPVGLLLKLMGKRVIYDSHENVPKQIMSKYWIPQALRGLVASFAIKVSRWAGKRFDGVIVAEPGIKKVFPGANVALVQNFAMPAEFDSIDLGDYVARPNNVTYIGSIMKIRGAMEMVTAMALVEERLNARLLLGGGFLPKSLHDEVAALPGWKSVDYLGWLDRPDVVSTMQRSRVGLLPLHPVPKNRDSQPVKIFEYMLAGLPIVSTNIAYYEQFIKDVECGIMVDPKNPQEIADAISWLLEHPEEARLMGERGRREALDKYTWNSEARKLVNFYREVIFRLV